MMLRRLSIICVLLPRTLYHLSFFVITTSLLYNSPSTGAQTTSSSCYWPNKTPAENHVPCSSDVASACCAPNQICLSNKLCLSVGQPFVLSRGSCTDPTYGSQNCPDKCVRNAVQQPGTECPIVVYRNDEAGIEYCCNSLIINNGTQVCDNAAPSFALDDATLIAGYAALADFTNSSASSPSGSIRDTSASNSSTAPPMATTVSAAIDCPAHTNEIAIGAGVGVPFGVIALIAIAALVSILRQRRKEKKTNARPVSQTKPAITEHYAPVAVGNMEEVSMSGAYRQIVQQPDPVDTDAILAVRKNEV